MNPLLIALVITLTQLPGIAYWYVPYRSIMKQKEKKQLLTRLAITYLINFTLFFIFYSFWPLTLNTYKLLMFIGQAMRFYSVCSVLKNRLCQHLFLVWSVAGISFFFHSIAAILNSTLFSHLSAQLQYINQGALYLLIFGAFCFPFYPLYKKTLANFASINNTYYWNIVWLVPFLIFMLNFALTLSKNWIPIDQLFGHSIMTVAILIVFYAISLDFKEQEKKIELTHNTRLLSMQVEAMEKKQVEEKEQKKQLYILRHDMHHRIQLLNSIISHNNIQEAQELLSEWNQKLDETQKTIFCENIILNAALTAYANRALQEGILLKIQVDFPSQLEIGNAQFAVVLANALENSLQATQNQIEKEIQVISRYENNNLALVIKNRFVGHIDFDEQGIPLTAKGREHGLGMRSILAFANKYQAIFTCTLEKNWFILRLMFKDKVP